MKRVLSKWIGSLTVVCVLVTSMAHVRMEVPAEVYTEHVIEAGDSYEGNPLKGFVPYNYGSMEFPHSMEWFYIAVNEVQTGMNEFDWTALEEKLDDVASRGHQAVMRFYYDYPDVETGVPQFLIDGGLEMKYYNEPIDLGGAGYAPDYENETFRQSMQNFIKAFGAEYDGDGRLAYVTLGLLGFWGEWHNWPYDEDTSDGREDWSISTEVYKEVLDAFDDAFDVTQLCVREPKYGIDYSGYDIGFHDDSFGYATLSTSKGGQSWSFMEKMLDFDLGNKWQTNCIGGEIYPPSQNLIFSGSDSSDGSYQNWDACMEETHATWMLCDAMRYYEGSMLEDAREAAVGLGYDFQVSKAYYADVVTTNSLYLQVDIKNIGCAPFYYDHNVWPVEIGVKQGNTVVKTWRTEWDLCDIPANSTDVAFSHSIDDHGLSDGTYTIGIKVINPVEGGNILGFANADQGSDGWLSFGTINVKLNGDEEEGSTEVTTEERTEETGEKETEFVTENETEVNKETGTDVATPDKTTVTAWETEDSIICDVVTGQDYQVLQLYIDTDINSATGFIDYSGIDAGFDYLFESGGLYHFSGNSSDWAGWSAVSGATVSVSDIANGKRVAIPKDSFVSYNSGARLIAKLVDATWTAIDTTEIVTVDGYENETEIVTEPETEVPTEPETETSIEEETDEVTKEESDIIVSEDIEIFGYQISTTADGLRTIYSYEQTVEGQEIEEVGLVYGIDFEGFNPEEMVVNSANKYVHSFAGTEENGRLAEAQSMHKSYAMTMKFAVCTPQEYTINYYVRAYAKLADGSYVYSRISDYSVFDIAEILYNGTLMNTSTAHNYLYTKILMVVDEKYPKKEYGWSPLVPPSN